MINFKSFLITALSSRCVQGFNESVRAMVGRGGLRVINFHRVLDNDIDRHDYRYLGESPTIAEFDSMISYLSSRYNMVSIKDYIQNNSSLDSSKLYVAITFDDGYLDNYINAYPVLNKYSVPATIFVSMDALDEKPLWFQSIYCSINLCDKEEVLNPCTNKFVSLQNKWIAMQVFTKSMLKVPVEEYNSKIRELFENCDVIYDQEVCESEQMMTWDTVKALKNDSLIDIGSHMVTHHSLISLSEAALMYELSKSYSRLQEVLEYKQMHMAYPNGMFDDRVKSFAKKVGYEAAFTMDRGRNSKNTDPFAMNREYVFNDPNKIGFQLGDWDLRLKKLFI